MNNLNKYNNTINSDGVSTFPKNRIQNLPAVLASLRYQPNIEQALQRVNFEFHRTCSISHALKECSVTERKTLLIFWGNDTSESRGTISMSASSCSSLHMPSPQQSNQRDPGLRSIAQQTDISCRNSNGISSPVNLSDVEEQFLRARIADSLTFSSPPSSVLQPAARSVSILGSVCALLLNKQSSAAKDASDSIHSRSEICRICFGGRSAERLVRPCSCRGTVAAVHRSCLERWLLQAATSHCELCRHHYIVTRTHKWSWTRSVAAWLRGGRGRALAADVGRGAALGAASVLGTARALHACDLALQAGARRGGAAALAANLFSSLLVGIVGALNGLLTTWMLLKIQEHQMSWQAWRDSTLHVHVSLAEPTPPATPSHASHASRASLATVVAEPVDNAGHADRATNVADPFMVAMPFTFPDS